MAQGFPFSMTVNGVEASFKMIELDESVDTIDASRRLLADNLTPNPGYTQRLPDLRTLTIDINALMAPGGGETIWALSIGLNSVIWATAYRGVTIYAGTLLYVENFNYAGSIPGEGRIRLRAYADGLYDKLI